MGGSSPFLSSFLVNWTGDEKAPAYILTTSAILGFIAVLKADIQWSKTLSKIVDFNFYKTTSAKADALETRLENSYPMAS